MTQTIPYWHVDAFSARPFGGNQAAVMVLDEWLADDVLVAIAAENLFAETAFMVRDATGAADWELRWCTPTYEIALCGHATLASGHILLTRDGGERVTFRTRKSGILEVRRDGAGYELALPAIPTAPRAYPEAVALLGAEPIEQELARQIAALMGNSGYDVDHLDCGGAVFQVNQPARGMLFEGQKSIHESYLDRLGPCVANLNFFVDDIEEKTGVRVKPKAQAAVSIHH